MIMPHRKMHWSVFTISLKMFNQVIGLVPPDCDAAGNQSWSTFSNPSLGGSWCRGAAQLTLRVQHPSQEGTVSLACLLTPYGRWRVVFK